MDLIKMKQKITRWHDDDRHKKIIDFIETVPQEARGYELTCLLARAYNNRTSHPQKGKQNWEKAIELLESVREKGQTDAKWHFRMGYALMKMEKHEEALACFLASEKLVDYNKDTAYFIDVCRRATTHCASAEK